MKKILTNIAWTISRIADPSVTICIYVGVIVASSGLIIQQQILLTPVIFLLTIMAPSIYFVILLREGKISDWDVTQRKEAIPLLIFTMVSWTIALIYALWFGTGQFVHLYLILYIIGLFLSGVTFFWKISIHAALITISMISLIVYTQIPIWLGAFFILITAWSRWYQKKHTIPQLIAGTLLSSAIAYFLL